MPLTKNQGSKNPAWKGGIVRLKNGYIVVHLNAKDWNRGQYCNKVCYFKRNVPVHA